MGPGEIVATDVEGLQVRQASERGNVPGELVVIDVEGPQVRVRQAAERWKRSGEMVAAEIDAGYRGPARVAGDPIPGAFGPGRAVPVGAGRPARAISARVKETSAVRSSAEMAACAAVVTSAGRVVESNKDARINCFMVVLIFSPLYSWQEFRRPVCPDIAG